MRLLGLGALYEDTILTVPRYPCEDGKLRAIHKETRIGGNIVNSFEVLSESPRLPTTCLAPEALAGFLGHMGPSATLELLFCAAVGNRESCNWIACHLERQNIASHLIHREGIKGPASAYILCTQDTGSRTVVSHGNNIKDPAVNELQSVVFSPQRHGISTSAESNACWPNWIHIEGRNCIAIGQLLAKITQGQGRRPTISVDFECPRDGLRDLIPRVDVLFISQTYAKHIGNLTRPNSEEEVELEPETLMHVVLQGLGRETKAQAIGYIMLGAAGCYAFSRVDHLQTKFDEAEANELGVEIKYISLQNSCRSMSPRFVYAKFSAVPLRKGETVESMGAGDTFIAGVIWALSARHNWLSAARLATDLAATKCTTRGFRGLWKAPRITRRLEKFVEDGPGV